MRKIPLKNYLLLTLISLITFIIIGYGSYWYKTTLLSEKSESVLSGYLAEVGNDEIITNISNYIIDNPNFILYITSGDNELIKNFENEFKTFIGKENIKSHFLFVDLNNSNGMKFLSELKEKFFSKQLKNKYFKLENQPNLFLFENREISKVLYYGEQKINIEDVKQFLKSEGSIIND